MMEAHEKTPNVDSLRLMPYSELKKIAKKHGIKGNLKAKKIIDALTSMNSDELESSFTPAHKDINSCKKNKEEKFNEDMMTPLVTPRRGTYSVGSPISLKVDDVSPGLAANDGSVVDMLNVTVGRGSERRLRPRKVSFMSPVVTPRTPMTSNLRLRPKTPIASHTSFKKTSPVPARQRKSNLRNSFKNTSQQQISIPETDALPQKTVTNESSVKTTKTAIQKSLTQNAESAAKVKRTATPNFKRIHHKAFEKMESIDDYQKRKLLNSAKKINRVEPKPRITKARSKIPAFSGIPFIPSTRTNTKLNSELNAIKRTDNKPITKSSTENVLQQSKGKFDLKASLSRKLGYKPYTGPLKPLADSNVLNTSCFHKEPVNKVVSGNRLQNRKVLKGVRTNKRFELQMKNRKLE